LMDFGIARAAERHTATRTGSVKGTIPFMSPEQASGLFVDTRSDLYSAGATLYELLTLVRAFPEGPRGPRPLPPSELRPELPPELDAFFARVLAFQADERPASAKQMLQELLRAASPLEPASDETVARWMEGLAAESEQEKEARPSATEATVSVPAPPRAS
jgi:eukaryotic-like serine/threonine-protein kinase